MSDYNKIDGRDLDNYITGHYGEDQFKNMEIYTIENTEEFDDKADYSRYPYCISKFDEGPIILCTNKDLANLICFELNRQLNKENKNDR